MDWVQIYVLIVFSFLWGMAFIGMKNRNQCLRWLMGALIEIPLIGRIFGWW